MPAWSCVEEGLPFRTVKSFRAESEPSVAVYQCPEQCLVHSRDSVNTVWTNGEYNQVLSENLDAICRACALW